MLILIKLNQADAAKYSEWLELYERLFQTNSTAVQRTECFFAIREGRRPYWVSA